ncbi:uncharacterized protein EDB91DRAFT_1114560 [Suillus paluster]|uniref:uncharacterized protein n=1 Tax=Suillus paluster TaxID=48578 RepID=UPI001B864960|nr:uncharacterized protein EDB91DRAFT_1114560 [Suillus paluster]KAG1747734.1 hypothetical protein EDB91DRAFT_1114560 [Suillus paluster]
MNSNPVQIIAVILCISSSVYAQDNQTYNNWGSRVAGIVIGSLCLLTIIACCLAVRRRRSMRNVTMKPALPATNVQAGQSYSLPQWNGAQMYAPPSGPPPGHSYNVASMSPYEYDAHPGSQPAPPPYVKEGDGVIMPQDGYYSSPSGPPPPAHTRDNSHFVGGLRSSS